MLSHSIVEPFDTKSESIKKMQSELDNYDKQFDQFLLLYPEAYLNAKVYKHTNQFNGIESVLHGIKHDMENMNHRLKVNIREGKEKVQMYTLEEDILEDVFLSLDQRLKQINPSNTSEQLKGDKVRIYRYNIVRMIYLLAGIGIMSGSIYHLIK